VDLATADHGDNISEVGGCNQFKLNPQLPGKPTGEIIFESAFSIGRFVIGCGTVTRCDIEHAILLDSFQQVDRLTAGSEKLRQGHNHHVS